MYKKWQYHFSEPQSLNFQGDTRFECCNLNGFWWNKSSVQYISHNQPTDGCAANKLAIVYCSLYCNILCSNFNFQKQRFLWNPFWSGSGSGHTCCLYFFLVSPLSHHLHNVYVWLSLHTLPAEMFGGSNFWLQTRVIIKISPRP